MEVTRDQINLMVTLSNYGSFLSFLMMCVVIGTLLFYKIVPPNKNCPKIVPSSNRNRLI